MQDSNSLMQIRKYLRDENGRVILTTTQLEMLERYRISYSVLMEQKSKRRAIPYIANFYSVHTNTATKYLEACEFLFGSVNDSSKAMQRQIASEMAIEVYEKAKATRNLDQMNKALGNYIKANGLHIDDADLPDFSRLQPHQEPIVLDFQFLEKYKGVIDEKFLDKIRGVLKEAKVYQYLEDADEAQVISEEGDNE